MNHYCIKIKNINFHFFNVELDLENQYINPDSFNIYGSIDLRLFNSFLKKSFYYMNKLETQNENLNSDFIDILESFELSTNIISKKISMIKIASYLIKYDVLRSFSWILSFFKQIKDFIISDKLEFLLKYLNFIHFIYFKFSHYSEIKEKEIPKEDYKYQIYFDELDIIYDNQGEYYSDSEDYDFYNLIN